MVTVIFAQSTDLNASLFQNTFLDTENMFNQISGLLVTVKLTPD